MALGCGVCVHVRANVIGLSSVVCVCVRARLWLFIRFAQGGWIAIVYVLPLWQKCFKNYSFCFPGRTLCLYGCCRMAYHREIVHRTNYKVFIQ